jgi:PAS domain-containing protein
MGSTADDTQGWISHGICEPCRLDLLGDLGTPLREFLETLQVPVVLAADDLVVEGANPAAQKVLGKAEEEMLGRRGGDVFDCAHASLPEGCGRTIHCSGCTIRNTVTDTYRNGTPHLRVPSTLTRGEADSPQSVRLHISTERVGGKVLLKVEGLE